METHKRRLRKQRSQINSYILGYQLAKANIIEYGTEIANNLFSIGKYSFNSFWLDGYQDAVQNKPMKFDATE